MYCEIYSKFSQAMLLLFTNHSIWCVVRFTVRSVKRCFFSSLQIIQFDVLSDLRYLQSSHASHHPVAPWLRRTADQCDGGVLPFVTGTLHAGHAATLCLLSSRDDSMGPRNLWGYQVIYKPFSKNVNINIFLKVCVSVIVSLYKPRAVLCFPRPLKLDMSVTAL